MSTERDIKESIRVIAKGGEGKTFFTAEVVAVSGNTCTVKSDNLEMSDVAICAIGEASGNSLLVVPKVGSTVLIADLSEGTRRDLVIVKYTEVESITINGGNLGGLVNIEQLTSKVNEFIKKFNQHTHVFKGSVEGTACSGTTNQITTQQSNLNSSDYEDTKIKH